MFNRKVARTNFQAAMEMGSVIYHMTARNARGASGNAVYGFITSILWTIFIGLALAAMMIYGFQFRRSLIRGDFIFFLLSGIFLYRMHVRTFRAASGMDGEMSGTMLHTQASTPVKVLSNAFAALYTQLLTILTIVFVYYLIIGHIDIEDPVGAIGMVMASWLTAICVGIVFMTLTPWAPGIVNKAKTIYIRLMFITSGKMFLGNTIPDTWLPYLDWNPLFHIIDQARGFIFINYIPHKTSLSYPFTVCIVLLLFGMMVDFITRRSASESWTKSRF